MKPDDALQLLRDADVDPNIIEALEGSGLRKDLRDATQRAEEAEARATRYRQSALKGQFAKHGVNLNPKHLAIPDELDEDDDEAVKAWLVEAGALPSTPAVPDEEFERQERVASAAATGTTAATAGLITPATAAEWPPDKFARFCKEHPDEGEALLRGEEVHGVTY